ncbi:hypothetical protein ACFPYI_01995 [Halomarina salina]|uniref:BZIP transcription factor n=1 Tax=Halomarina salina TaxID=1872699 RepID=A0ABD5RIF9_9EURY|nr:hypothetical protein [Halomarina salina]
MSTDQPHRADQGSMTREEAVERIEKLDDKLFDLAEHVYNGTDERVEELEAENEQLRERVGELEELVGTLQEKLRDETSRRGKEDGRMSRRLTAVEDELGMDSEEVLTIAAGGEGGGMTPLGRVIKLGPEGALERPTAKHYRARAIAERWSDWGTVHGTKYGRKRVLASKRDDLKTRLEDANDESIAWNQVYRAMEWVAENSGGVITLREGNDEEGRYVLEQTEPGGDSA